MYIIYSTFDCDNIICGILSVKAEAEDDMCVVLSVISEKI